MTLAFEQPLGPDDTGQIDLSSTLSVPAGEQVALPRIRLLGAQVDQAYVSLPTQLNAQRIAWELAGMRPVVRGGQPTWIEVPQHSALFRQQRTTARAVLMPQLDEPAVARIRVAEYCHVYFGDGHVSSLAKFALPPSTIADWQIEIPSSHQLVSVTLNSLAVPVHRHADDYWNISVGTSPLPQTLAVIYRRPGSPNTPTTQRVPRPRLFQNGRELVVETSLWTIRSPQGTWPRIARGVRPASVTELALRRLEERIEVIRAASAALLQQEPDQVERFRSMWRGEIDAALRLLDVNLQRTPSTRQIMDRAEMLRAAARVQLDDPEVSTPAGQPGRHPGTPNFANSDLLWWSTWFADGGLAHAITRDGDLDIQIAWRNEARSDQWRRLLAALFVAGATVVFAGRPGAWRSRPRASYLPLLLILGGLAAWFWLWPSWLGLVLIAVGLVDWLRKRAATHPHATAGIAAA